MDGNNTALINSEYSYDLIGNIIEVKNMAVPVGLKGGGYENIYTYDNYNRLYTATGEWTGAPNQTQGNPEYSSFELVMGYENMHRINSKTQIHLIDGTGVDINSYENKYEYGDPLHPNAVSKITELLTQEEELFSYDANGNLLEHIQPAGENKNLLWDDDNLLKAIKIADDVALQHYFYDADGERAMKGTGQVSEIELNGQPEGYEASLGNYVQYFSPYAVVGANGQLSKHYYAGSERIVSRLSGEADLYSENSHLSGSQTGSLDDRQEADQEFVFDEFDLVGLQIINQPPDPEDCEVNEDCGSILFFYHKDHLGSSSFLTDEGGFAYQFLLHLPFGETMAEQRVGGYSSRYKFTGKEQDEETGLYYFGARYYDPRLSLWFGVDPMAEKYPGWNPFNYTLNNPIRYIDPTGMETVDPDTDPIKSVLLDEVTVTAKRIYKTQQDNTGVNRVLSSQLTQRSVQNYATFSVPPQEKLNNAIAKNSAEFLKLAIGDPQDIRDGDIGSIVEIGANFFPWGRIAKIVAKGVTIPKIGIKYFDEIGDLSNFTKNQLVSYSKQLESLYKSGKIGALTRDQAALLVKQAKKLGVEVRIDKGHPGTFWNMDHLNIGPSGYHVPILPK